MNIGLSMEPEATYNILEANHHIAGQMELLGKVKFNSGNKQLQTREKDVLPFPIQH